MDSQTQTAESYVRAIRNADKREYANAWLAWLLKRGPEPVTFACSYMAAQAVRLALGSFTLAMPRECQWFRNCTRPATGTTAHPVLGQVPTCDNCAEFAR